MSNGQGSRPSFGMPTAEHVRHLPKAPPELPVVEFTGRAEGWPPRPAGAEEFAPLPVRRVADLLTDEREAQLRTAAFRDERVTGILGERFAHIDTDLVDSNKGKGAQGPGPVATRLTFFSHTNSVAVEVWMRGDHVHQVEALEGYQPTEGLDEISEAIGLAREDARIADQVRHLAANAILLPNAVQDRSRNRLMWVVFTDPAESDDEKPVLFVALVELITRSVLLTRAEPPVE